MENSQKLSINPYLGFNGTCREAMNFYNSVLGGELFIMDYGSAPMDTPPDHNDKVIHASLAIGNAVIMAADAMPGQELNYGNAHSVMVAPADVEEGQRIFAALSEGGTVTMPFEKQFWGAIFGMFIDKFGIQWMVDCELPQEEE